ESQNSLIVPFYTVSRPGAFINELETAAQDFAHIIATQKASVMVMISQAFAQLLHMLIGSNNIAAHRVDEPLHARADDLHAPRDNALLFQLVLPGRFDVQVLEAELHQLVVLLEKLWQVEGLATVVALLVEIHCPYPNLDFLEIWRKL